jgi:uncharacterized membrane-anchored protein YhcB (DUF1043 family)
VSWDDVIKVALTAVGGVAGIGLIIGAAVKFSADRIAERLSQKYQLQMNKEFVRYKNNLDKKTYISQARFDKEFEIYQELSEKVLTMVFDFAELIRTIRLNREDHKDLINNTLRTAVDSYNETNKATREYAPFMSENMYILFIQLGDKCRNQLLYYRLHYKDITSEKITGSFGEVFEALTTDNIPEYSKFETQEKLKLNQREISELLDTLMNKLRGYLWSLEVI